MGLRRKIGLGLTAISVLLFFAGLISYLEITRLESISKTVVALGAKSVVISNEMLDIMSHQDSAIIKFIETRDTVLFKEESKMTLNKLQIVSDKVDSSFQANSNINNILEDQKNFIYTLNASSDSTKFSTSWYFSTYKADYNKFVYTVKQFMRSTQQTVVDETEKLTQSAYRAIKQGIITLITAIVIIIMFFMLIDTYYINPVIKITKALKNYHDLKIPFNVTVVGRDEVYMLKEYIEQLMLKIDAKKRNKNNPF
ncbi:MAG: hypothetical protein R3Y51_04290 [Rikenellaceae bacterium]